MRPSERPACAAGTWWKAVLVTAVACGFGAWAPCAQALGLGTISIQSALGEPLHAEVEITGASAADVSAFSADIASPEDFEAAGVEYNDVLKDVRVSLQHRANGQAYVRILGVAAVDIPVVHVILVAHWTRGHLTRNYTVLLDPRGRAAVPSVVATDGMPARRGPAAAGIPVAVQATSTTESAPSTQWLASGAPHAHAIR